MSYDDEDGEISGLRGHHADHRLFFDHDSDGITDATHPQEEPPDLNSEEKSNRAQSEVLMRLLVWLDGATAEHCRNKVKVLLYVLVPEYFKGKSMSQIAKQCGVTSSALSQHARFLREQFDLESQHGRRPAARDKMSVAAQKTWSKRKAKLPPEQKSS